MIYVIRMHITNDLYYPYAHIIMSWLPVSFNIDCFSCCWVAGFIIPVQLYGELGCLPACLRTQYVLSRTAGGHIVFTATVSRKINQNSHTTVSPFL